MCDDRLRDVSVVLSFVSLQVGVAAFITRTGIRVFMCVHSE